LAISDPKWEVEYLRHVTVKSENLKGRGDVTLFVPPHVKGRLDVPLILLLHGVYGSHWNWTRKGGAHRTALRMIEAGTLPPVVIAMPSDGLQGDGTGYLTQQDRDFERWIVDDVPQLAQEVVPAVTAESSRLIAGLSMGGFGAMRIGAKYGPQFIGISAHSAVTDTTQFEGIIEEPIEDLSIHPQDHHLADVLIANRDRLPPLRFDCGVDDPLIDPNRALHNRLTETFIAHRFEEHSGTHEWAYWEEHLEDTLEFFAQLLDASR
jgi:S-formylglutathione hydrolase FrmB